MLVIDSSVRAAGARRDLGAGIRYAVVRLAELLDPETPFVLSGCAYCDPLAAVAAFESAARDFLSNPGVRFGTVLAASQLLSDALEQEGNLRAWYPGDLTRLLLFLAQVRKVPSVRTVGERQAKVPYHERTTWVRQKLSALVDGSLARFRAAVESPRAGYRERLLDGLTDRLLAGPGSERDWAELDHDLCYAAALLLGQGRDGRELARHLARRVAAASDDPSAVRTLREVVEAAPAPYRVALALSGARSLEPESAASLGVVVLDRRRPRWDADRGAGAGAERALAAFVADRAPPGACTPLLVSVSAWDREQARVRAMLVAQALLDHLVVEHPAGRFSLGPEALVLGPAGGLPRRTGGPAPALREGRVSSHPGAPELLPFLRANALARGEVSPVLRILHTWIALEYLAREGAPVNGGGGTELPALSPRPDFTDDTRSGWDVRSRGEIRPKLEGYLPPHLASVAAMSGLQGQLLASWDAVRGLALRSPRRAHWQQVERWLDSSPPPLAGGGGPKGRRGSGWPPNLGRLVDLLRALNDPVAVPPAELSAGAPAAVAAGFLLDLCGDLGPFARRRLEVLGRQLDHGSRLAKAAEAVQVRTLIAIARLKLARHLAVHRGFDAAQASPPLALSAMMVLESAFEVLRRWMRPGCRPWEAMAEARRWHEQNLAAWRSAADPELDADHLLHPEIP